METKMTHHSLRRRRHALALGPLAGALSALMVVGCASLAPASAPVATAAPAAQWQAPLPAAARTAASVGVAPSPQPTDRTAELKRWWLQFNDTPLALLIDAAQAASPSVAAARSRIEQARAARVAGGAALGPTADARAGLARYRVDLATPILSSATVGLQAAWELDLFGANAAGRDAAQARLEGAQAGWHDARISVAAETASAYLVLRACEAQLAQTTLDAASRAEISRLTGLATDAGFQAPAAAALARASAAQGNASLTQQRAQCDLAVKALVALTAVPEPALRERLRPGAQRLPEPAQLSVAQVPAAVLAQRPDLFIAERELAAAGADLTQARAQRYPRIALAGSITPTRLDIGGVSANGTVWSVGPVTVTLPIFDGGVRRANAQAAQAAALQQVIGSHVVPAHDCRRPLISRQVEPHQIDFGQLFMVSGRLKLRDFQAERGRRFLKSLLTPSRRNQSAGAHDIEDSLMPFSRQISCHLTRAADIVRHNTGQTCDGIDNRHHRQSRIHQKLDNRILRRNIEYKAVHASIS